MSYSENEIKIARLMGLSPTDSNIPHYEQDNFAILQVLLSLIFKGFRFSITACNWDFRVTIYIVNHHGFNLADERGATISGTAVKAIIKAMEL